MDTAGRVLTRARAPGLTGAVEDGHAVQLFGYDSGKDCTRGGSSFGRALAWHARGDGFESRALHIRSGDRGEKVQDCNPCHGG